MFTICLPVPQCADQDSLRENGHGNRPQVCDCNALPTGRQQGQENCRNCRCRRDDRATADITSIRFPIFPASPCQSRAENRCHRQNRGKQDKRFKGCHACRSLRGLRSASVFHPFANRSLYECVRAMRARRFFALFSIPFSSCFPEFVVSLYNSIYCNIFHGRFGPVYGFVVCLNLPSSARPGYRSSSIRSRNNCSVPPSGGRACAP